MNKLTKIPVVVTCLAIGYFSGNSTRSAIIDWYPREIKPSFKSLIGFLLL
jgi:tryptophan-rich sensory protein